MSRVMPSRSALASAFVLALDSAYRSWAVPALLTVSVPLTVSPGISGLRPITALAGEVLMSIVPAVNVLPPTTAWSVHKPSEKDVAVTLTAASASPRSSRTRRRLQKLRDRSVSISREPLTCARSRVRSPAGPGPKPDRRTASNFPVAMPMKPRKEGPGPHAKRLRPSGTFGVAGLAAWPMETPCDGVGGPGAQAGMKAAHEQKPRVARNAGGKGQGT